MTLKELAAYLKLNERTVLKLATEGRIPGVRIARQWRFKREKIEMWLEGLTETGASLDETAERPRLISPAEIISPEAIDVHFAPGSRKEVVEKMVELLGRMKVVKDKAALIKGFIERENMMSTALPGGSALLHCRKVPADAVTAPALALAVCPAGFRFGAPQCEPTRVFFGLVAPSDRLHLALMSALAPALRQEKLIDALAAAANEAEAYEILSKALSEQLLDFLGE